MHPDHAAVLRDAYVAQLEQEHTLTKRVLAAVPDDKAEYTPDPKSMKAIDLAWHIASSEMWFCHSIANGEFSFGESNRPAELDTAGKIAAWYEAGFPQWIERVKGLSNEHMAKEVTFAIWNDPNVKYLSFAIVHSVHHRGQLSAYLRPMGAKVPGIYGGSADEPMEMPATEAASAQA